MISSFVFEVAAGFLTPILAVFITGNVTGGTVAVAGFAVAIYWIVKAILQIPVGYYLDKKAGETDDVIALVIGHFIFAAGFFLYLIVQTPLHIYLVQALLAVGGALAVPPWFGMFMRHVDKYREDFEWSVQSSLSFGLCGGIASAVGGIIAHKFGFDMVFIVSGIFSIVSSLILIPLYTYLKKQTPIETKN